LPDSGGEDAGVEVVDGRNLIEKAVAGLGIEGGGGDDLGAGSEDDVKPGASKGLEPEEGDFLRVGMMGVDEECRVRVEEVKSIEFF
jgi:hypothetical protein